MDVQEWEIRFTVYLVEGDAETTVNGSVFRWTSTEKEAEELFLSQWKRTYRKNKDWFADLVSKATGISETQVPGLRKTDKSPDIDIIEIRLSES